MAASWPNSRHEQWIRLGLVVPHAVALATSAHLALPLRRKTRGSAAGRVEGRAVRWPPRPQARPRDASERGKWIHGGAAEAEFEVQVWPGRTAGSADRAEARADGDARPPPDRNGAEMCIPARHSQRVAENDEVAVTARAPARRNDAAGGGGAHGRARVRHEVEARMMAGSSRPEGVAEQGVDGGGELQRRMRWPAPQGRQRCSARGAV